ncbi:MAG: HIT domain-containing protein [Candidatus Vogelbacteria bacterium]|nr:HIT domain-containing protein [Candidatus Vogelbacteria bacterium]
MRKSSKHVNLAHSRSGDYKKLLYKINTDNVCPFCELNLKKYHTEPILKEGKYWLITTNQNPYNGLKHHILIICKRHIETISEINKNESIELISLSGWVNTQFKINGGVLMIRFGNTDYTGASVTHLHGHIVSGGKRHKDTKSIKIKLGYKIARRK